MKAEHAASFDLLTGELLIGDLSAKEIKIVKEYILKYRLKLKVVFNLALKGQKPPKIPFDSPVESALAPRLLEVWGDDTLTLYGRFDGGTVKAWPMEDDLKELGGELATPLLEKDFFKQVTVDSYGFLISWPNEFDIDPDDLWELGLTIERAAG